MLEHHLTTTHTDQYAETLLGRFVDWRNYDLLIGDGDATVYKPDGSPLLVFRKRAFDPALCVAALPGLRKAATPNSNRGMAAGGRRAIVKRNGRPSRGTYTARVQTGIIGFFDRTARYPYCRATSYTRQEVMGWRSVLPLVRSADAVFRQAVPDRYAAQLRAASRTPPEWVIPGTTFTTVTVNRNFRTAVHRDRGDLPEGFGVMSVVRSGEYSGGHLVFPKFRVAVDMDTSDVLLADVHELHGNTGIEGEPGWERISLVMYFRRRMVRCLPCADEVRWAKGRPAGSPL
jgi:hypothetical protein